MSDTQMQQNPYSNGSASSSDSMRDTASATWDSAKEKASGALEDTQARFDAAVADGSKELQKLADQSSDFVKKNPGLAVAGAVGFGVLLGLALRNRY